MKTVVGLLKSKNDARDATEQLVASGFSRDSINILASEESRREYMGEGAVSDTTQEPFFQSGTNFGVLSGKAPLVGMGVLDEDASYYSEGVNRGGFLVTVSCEDDRADFAADILQQCGAIDVDEESRSWREEGWSSSPDLQEEPFAGGIPSEQVTTQGGFAQEQIPEARLSDEGIAEERQAQGRIDESSQLSESSQLGREGVIPVVEEEIQVGKREVRKGGVRVYSRISEVPVEEEIRLREEHAKVERRPVDRPASEFETEAFQERSFEIRETAEEPVVSKEARVKEEVVVGTESSERTEVVRDTLRRTDVEVEQTGEGYGRQVADMDDEEFISHFNNTYGQSGERFEETYRSAYHFAESESRNPQLMDREWYEVEDQIHSDWESSHPGTWNKVQQAIHYGWDRIRRHH